MSQTELIMIDDTDSGISYTGNWTPDRGSVDNLGNYGAPYMSTNHYTKGTGSFSYTFFGTYVGVFGTTLDGNDPVRKCTVDGNEIDNNHLTAAENGVMHCQVNGLPDGKHTIVVTVPSPNANGYWFDYLMYIPSASVSRTNAVTTILVGDPSMSFGSGWGQNGPGYIATSNGATFNMQFTGRSLTWLGYYFSQLPFASTTATWTIDNGTPMTFSLNGVKSQNTGAEFNQRFFTTGILPAGRHNLKVVYNGNSGTTPLSIYQVIIQNGASAGGSVGGAIGSSTPNAGASTPQATTAANNNPTTSGNTGSSGSTSAPTPVAQQSTVLVIGSGSEAVTVTVPANSTSTQGSTGSSGSSGATATGTGSSPNSSGKTSSGGPSSSDGNSNSSGGTNNAADTSNAGHGGGKSATGPIVGAVVGVIALLLLLLLVFFIRRRRNKKRLATQSPNVAAATIVQPFTNPPNTPAAATMSEVGRSGYTSESQSNHYPSPAATSPVYAYTDEKRQPLAGPSHVLSPSLSTFSSPSTSNGPESDIIMLHHDSGVRLPLLNPTQSGANIVEMPPTYSAI